MYTPTIGLEIHAELKTRSKMFCATPNEPGKAPNTNICSVCTGQPGALPVPNREAVRQVLRIGVAIGGTLADYTEFDRKNYFYPDLPKGYQISQHLHPLVTGGALGGVAIERVHLEEDTATSRHDGATSIVDFNRAGVPLMELVTKPVIHDSESAVRFAKELQRLIRALGAGEAQMEKGQLRIEANISVSKDAVLGTKVEVKNLNSFRSVERAIRYEIERQTALLESGGIIQQETRGFDEAKGITVTQRIKENSDDYRYLPDPDIPKLQISEIKEFGWDALKSGLPELPEDRRKRYATSGARPAEIEVLIENEALSSFYELEVLSASSEIRESASNILFSELRGSSDVSVLGKLRGGRLISVAQMFKEGTISSLGAKKLLTVLIEQEGDPIDLAKKEGLLQNSDSREIEKIVEKVIQNNTEVFDELRGGKQAALQFLVGKVLKESGGSANPKVVIEIIQRISSS